MNKLIVFFIFFSFSFILITPTFAQNSLIKNRNFNISNYQIITDTYAPDIQLPTVVELPLNPNEYDLRYAAIKELNSQEFQPYTFTNVTYTKPFTPKATDNLTQANLIELTDSNQDTYVEFPLNENNLAIASILLDYNQYVTADSLNIKLSPNSTTPTTISISKNSDRSTPSNIIYNQLDYPISSQVKFPETQSRLWQITLTSDQPIRISQITLNTLNNPITTQTGLRFLTRPGEVYQIYLSPDRQPDHPNLSTSNYKNSIAQITIPTLARFPNPNFKPSDFDYDNIPDNLDNCPRISNPDQIDNNKNLLGDACEDFDIDGIINNQDNCPDHPNPNQQDTDSDNIGDHCDPSESRFTESYPFIPWLGLGFGFVVVLIILFTTKNKFAIQKENLNLQKTEKITDLVTTQNKTENIT